jgi:hypothetical protein
VDTKPSGIVNPARMTESDGNFFNPVPKTGSRLPAIKKMQIIEASWYCLRIKQTMV